VGISLFHWFQIEEKKGANSAVKYDQDCEVAITDLKPFIANTGTYTTNVKRATMIKEQNNLFNRNLQGSFVSLNMIERRSQIMTIPKG